MKKLYLIGGPMGIGKTTIGQLLKEKLNNAVFLDGDWCWDSSPFQVTEETKAMVMDNISYLLNNFIHCSAYENVIFCWVMHEQTIIDDLLARLDLQECDVKVISLVCTVEALTRRLNKDINAGIRKADVLERSLSRLPMYETLNTIKIDVSYSTPGEVADLIVLQ
ncbi:MAG: AAA family ATPase [Epulopiscium sp.]|jgi:broad-specificity NMP kinase|nr:AAA family ATPase [Candidatus Epulonipiscium sp.]